MGELLIHGVGLHANQEEIEDPFYRAIELDPYRAVLYAHPVVFPFGEPLDSFRAADLVQRFASAAEGLTGPARPDSDPRGGPLAMTLVFGDSASQAQEWRRVLSAARSGNVDEAVLATAYLQHPRFFDRFREAFVASMEAFEGLLPAAARYPAVLDAVYRGRLEAWAGFDDTPVDPVTLRWLYALGQMGLPVPPGLLEGAIGTEAIGGGADVWTLRYAGFHAANEGRWSDFSRALEALEEKLTPSDTAGTSDRHWVDAVRGYGIWKQGDPEGALPYLEDMTGPGRPANRDLVWHLGALYEELGRWGDAERLYRGAWLSIADGHGPFAWLPAVRERLAIVLEAQGREREAAGAFAFFAEHWSGADPAVQDRVQRALRASGAGELP